MGKKGKYIQTEILIWIMVLLLLMLGVSVRYHLKLKEYEVHNAFFTDANGLTVGSPVNFMGVRVGYVKKINIIDNTVYIKFVIKDKDFHLPWGTSANIEFSGLAGTRSIELYPPDKNSDGENIEYLNVRETTKLNEVSSLFNDMYNKFTDIYLSLSIYGSELGKIFIEKK